MNNNTIIMEDSMIKKIIRVPGRGEYEFPFMTREEVLTDEQCLDCVRAQIPDLAANAQIAKWEDSGVDENGLHTYTGTVVTRAQTKG